MQSSRDLKRRIRSVKNIAQITKAMEVVSMTKMRRSQQFALSARPYALASLDMLQHVLHRTPRKYFPVLLRERTITHALLVVIAADKGLVGGFNENIMRKAESWMKEKREQGIQFSIMTVGKKARDYFLYRTITPITSFIDFGDYTEFKDTEPVAHAALLGFIEKKWDSVDVVYTHFKTTLKQETTFKNILPAKEATLQELVHEIIPESGLYSELRGVGEHTSTQYDYTYTFEPSPKVIIADLVTSILKIAFHHIMLESNASEHSARMVTMKSASDNADELQGNLTLEMNKARQTGITAEISEIIAGAEALQ